MQWLSEKKELDLVEQIASLIKIFSRRTKDNHAYRLEVREIEKERIEKDMLKKGNQFHWAT